MKKTFLFEKKLLLLVALFTSFSLITSCSDDDKPVPTPEVSPEGYSLLTNVGAFPNITSYLHKVNDLDKTEISSKDAKELSYTALMFGYKDFVYLSKFGNPATITKYNYNSEGVPIEEGKFVDPTSNVMSSVVFVSETEAYAANAGRGSYKIIKFNPSTMQRVGEVDMSMIDKPEVKQIMLQGLVKRGNKLYTGVNYMEDHFNLTIKSTFVAVIDLDKMKVTKLLKDDRTALMFGGRNTLQLDESTNDIYVMTSGVDSDNLPSGALRIKNGEDKFDTSYFLDFKKLTGGFCKSLMVYGGSKALIMKIENPDDIWETKGPNYKYYKLDLKNKTTSGAIEGLPLVYSDPAFLIRVNDNEFLLNAATGAKSILYSFNPKSEEIKRKVTVEGKLSYMYIHRK